MKPIIDGCCFDVSEMVQVDWVDSFMAQSWQDREESLRGECKDGGICRSVGFLLENTELWVTLAHSISANDNVAGCITIPKSAIVDMAAVAVCR